MTIAQATSYSYFPPSWKEMNDWVSEMPKAPPVAGLSSLGTTLWYGFAYRGLSSAPWQTIVGGAGASLITAPFEIYQNYSLWREGKRSLDHAVLDGVGDTLSAGLATYIGGSLASLIIPSAAAGAAIAPFGAILAAGVIAGVLSYGICCGLSALKDGILKEFGISSG